jgi:hypothetical protein
MRRLSIALLNKIENDVSQRHNWRATEAVQGIWSPTITLDVSGITPEFANPSVPNPASAHDPLLAAALIWAHRDAIQWSMSLSWNDFHLAHKVLFLVALMSQDLAS